MTENTVICIVGSTATGKSGLAIELAKILDGEIVSADSMQIYRGFTVGTAKVMSDEMQGIPHHLIDIIAPDATFSVAEYCEYAQKAIDDILRRRKVPVLVGGTGLYIDSLMSGISFDEMQIDEDYRESLVRLAQDKGNDAVWQQLSEIDPVSAQALHPNNLRRVIRALEIHHITGQPFSVYAKQARGEAPYSVVYIGLRYRDRQKLYNRIDQRVDEMMENGLLDELRNLIEQGVPTNCQAFQAIGYKELIPVLDGERILDEAIELIKRNSRRYAKRQYTWFKRNSDIHWIDVDCEDVILRAKEILHIG